MEDRARELCELLSSGGAYKFQMIALKDSGKRLRCPQPPHLLANRQLVATLARNSREVLNPVSSNSKIAIDSWVRSVPLNDIRITLRSFSDSPQGCLYRDFLEELGIEYRWISYDKDRNRALRKQWKEILSKNRPFSVEKEDPPQGAGRSAREWMAIEPVFPAMRSANASGGSTGAEAFRYFMLMAAIYTA
jgi:hypothetical protein